MNNHSRDIYFTTEEKQHLEGYMISTQAYIEELKRIDAQTLKTLEMIFGKREE